MSHSALVLAFIIALLVYFGIGSCEGQHSPSSSSLAPLSNSGSSNRRIPGGSGDGGGNSFPLSQNDIDPASEILLSNNYVVNNNGNGLSSSSHKTHIQKRSPEDESTGGGGGGPDFKSLVHGLPDSEQNGNSKNSNEDSNLMPSDDASDKNPYDIAELTTFIGNSLKSLESAAELASSTTGHLKTMLGTIQENSAGIIQQVEIMRNLSSQLSKEIEKPLAQIEPLVETQIDFARTITSSVMKLSDKIDKLEKNMESIILFSPIVLLSSLATNLLAIIIIMCLICTCRSIRNIDNNIRKNDQGPIEPLYSNYGRSGPRPSIAHPPPHPFRNIEMDEMNLRNSLRTHL